MVNSHSKATLLPSKIKPIISVKEARKLLGKDAKDITNEELLELLLQQEQIVRFIIRKYNVRK